jgi:ribosomal protein S18 acetylase RimI-like enzyme
MLRLLTETDRPAFDAFAREYPLDTVRIAALLAAYGAASPFFETWMSEDRLCAVARLDGAGFLAAAPGADPDELAAFFRFGPGFASLTGPVPVVEAVAAALGVPQGCLRRFERLRFERFPPSLLAGQLVCGASPLREAYAVLAQAGEADGIAFDAWYADMSHRLRHGCARAYTAGTGRPVSACLVAAESAAAGLIAGVATLPDFRGRGYASSLVLRAAEDLRAAGKCAVLECAQSLLPFYQKLGFATARQTAVLSFPVPSRR